ncbi:MAG: mycofactocin precursor [Deltaproteobacteria bacterium]|nr:mycofactocin precursor [Deltaproteobacteria bacterium]
MARQKKAKATKERRAGSARPPAPPQADGEPRVLEEIRIEELAIDGICGVY